VNQKQFEKALLNLLRLHKVADAYNRPAIGFTINKMYRAYLAPNHKTKETGCRCL